MLFIKVNRNSGLLIHIMNTLSCTFTEFGQFVFGYLLKLLKYCVDTALIVLLFLNLSALVCFVLYLEIAVVLYLMEQLTIIDSFASVLNHKISYLTILFISAGLVSYAGYHIKATKQTLLDWINSRKINTFFVSTSSPQEPEIVKDDQYWSNFYFQRAEKFRYGEGVDQNIEYALKLYQAAAKLGNAQAQISLSYLLLVNNISPEQKKEAFAWALQAAQMNEPAAFFNLGCMYKNGLGTRVDYVKALTAFEQAIHNGFYNIEQSGEAYFEMGMMFLLGQGTAINYQKAIRWLTSSYNN